MKKEVNIDYSIVSRGTEKYNNHGYVAISEKVGSYRYILNVDHGLTKASFDTNYLKFKEEYTIEDIAFSRFQLITALMYQKHKSEIVDNILIMGLGNIGITCLFYLMDKGYKKITIYVREIASYMNKLIETIKEKYQICIQFITKLENLSPYNTIIDTTGSSVILQTVFEIIDCNKSIIILSTPRDELYLFSPLIINRKNLVIIGGHEFNGIDEKHRNKLFRSLLKINDKKKYLKDFVSTYNYSTEKLEQIKNKKSNFIEIFRY